MSGFLYYIPGKTRAIGPGELLEAGLGYALSASEGHCPTPEVHANGPDGGAGVLAADDRRIETVRVQVDLEHQTWVKAPGGKYWVGCYTADRPTPKDLVRADALPGNPVTLGDGNEWVVPLARAQAEHADECIGVLALPQTMGLDEHGEWQPGDTVAEHARLWEIAVAYWDAKMAATVAASQDGKGTALIEFDKPNDAAVHALATNYAIDRVEVVALGLLVWNGPQVWRVLDALVDWDAALTWLEKKTEQDGLDSDAGPPDDTAATDPA